LAECIESILTQTYKKFELMLVNDGSTDSSQDVIDYYAKKDKRITVLIHKRNLGRSQTRNDGMLFAKGSVICVQDADDVAGPDRISKTVSYFNRNPKVSVIYSSFYTGDFYGNAMNLILAKPFIWTNLLKTKFTNICHSTMSFRTKVLNKVKYSYGEYSDLGIDDWKFQIDLHRAGFKFGYIKKPLVLYRQVSDSITLTRDNDKVNKLKERCLREKS